MKKSLLVCLLSAICAASGFAEKGAQSFEEADRVAQGLHYQQGEVSLPGGLAKLNVPAEFRFLNADDAQTVLVKIWGNPPQSKPLGMIFPANAGPTSPDAWAVVITYESEGYVRDDDADKIKYHDLLKEMQSAAREASKERVKQGYRPVEIVGWAESPRYDKATHKLYWAKELKFGDDSEHTLNYNIRILGRHGVLVLNTIGGMEQLESIKQGAPQLLSMVDFNAGSRYADFDPKVDKVATYGIAALVAGGVAAKMGFFKVLIAGLLAAKKFVIIGIVAVGAWVKRLINGREHQA